MGVKRRIYQNSSSFINIEAEWRMYASVIKSSLVQIMACRLVGAKPLSEFMPDYSQLDH